VILSIWYEEHLCTDLNAVEERIKRDLSGHIYAAAAIVITVLTLVNLVLG